MTDEQPPDERVAGVQGRMAWLLIAVRYVLPVAAMVAGVIIMLLGGESNVEGGAGIVGAGIAIYAINWLYRAAVDGDSVRDEEEAARTYLSIHGHWPDETDRP